MKHTVKRRLALLLAVLLLAGLCACGKPSDPAEEPPQDEPEIPSVTVPEDPKEPDVPEEPDEPEPVPVPVTVESRASSYTVTEDGITLMEYTLSYPSLPELEQVDAYYAALEQLRMEEIGNTERMLPQLRAEAETSGMPFLTYTYDTDYQVLRNDGLILSVLRTNEDFSGGVHSQRSYAAETILVEEQRLLTLDELFTVPGEEYLPRLLDGILQAMDKAERDAGTAIYYEDSRDSLSELLDTNLFALAGDSLVLIFPEYVLAPYAAGPQIFRLPTAEYLDILNDAWFFS